MQQWIFKRKEVIKMEKVLLGMSGGVDSSVAAIVLKEKGYEVVGVTMVLWENENNTGCMNLNTVSDAKKVCEKLRNRASCYEFKRRI